MLKAEQIPDEVVKAALEAWKKDTETFHPNAGTLAAAINAWPGSYSLAENDSATIREMACFILPFTENTND